MADNLVYEESLASEDESSDFISKKWVYVNDTNAQNYQSQTLIDTTPLSNAGGWLNWSEAFMVMPLVVQLTADTPANLPFGGGQASSYANYSWAFKSGFWQMIHSMTVEFNNQNIVQQTPFLNVFRSFKANTSFSQDDLKNEGASLGFYPDSPDSWSYCNEFCTGNGAGGSILVNSPFQTRGINIPYTNNTNAYSSVSYTAFNSDDATTAANYSSLPSIPQTTASGIPNISLTGAVEYSGYPISLPAANPITPDFTPFPVNQGMYERQKYNNYNSGVSSSFGQGIVNPAVSCNTVYRSSLDLQQSQEGNYIWNVFAKLRLKDLEEFFEKCPLLKGSTMRFYINTNQSLINYQITSSAIVPATGAPIYGDQQIDSVQIIEA